MDSKMYKMIGDAVAKAEKEGGDLTTKNLKYVWHVAEQMAKQTGADVDDLFKEGVIEMRRCEQKYDPDKNDNFTKSCALAIRGVMKNFVNRQNQLVHIPVNHQNGFKAGQRAQEDVKVTYESIDASDYDRYGYCDNYALFSDKYEILIQGLSKLDESAQIAIKMKLHLDKYSETIPSEKNPSKQVYKYKNNIQAISEELEVTPGIAKKIYQEAFEKLSRYCQSQYNSQ